MQKNVKNNNQKLLNSVVLLLVGIVFLVYLYLFVVCVIVEPYKYNYLYIAVYDPMLLIVTILFSLILPLLLCLSCYFSLRIRKLSVKIITVIVCVVLLILLFLPNILLLGLGGGVASYTENIDNYGKFDNSVLTTLEKYLPEDFFPNKEFLHVNSRYSYYYEYGFLDENYSIQLDAQFISQNEYFFEQSRLMNLELISFSENTYYIFSNTQQSIVENSQNEFSECSVAVIHFNNSNQQIMYKVFRSENSAIALEHISQLDKQ